MLQLNTDWTPIKVPEGPRHPNLVMIRTGASTIHKTWAKAAERKWDLLVSHFDEKSEPDAEADIVVRQGAFKYSAYHRLFQDIPWLSRYESIWLCDDDIATSWDDIAKLFDVFKAFSLDLAQPSLTPDSFCSHLMCIKREETTLRFTNFAEAMVPLFSRAALAKCLPSFEGTATGWGLDYVWPHLLENPKNKIAVIDAVAVRHTRPVGTGDIRDQVSKINISAEQEYQGTLKKYGLTAGPFLEYGSIRREGLWSAAESELERHLSQIMKPFLLEPPAARAPAEAWHIPQAWTGGAAAAYEISRLEAEDRAMSVGFSLALPVSFAEAAQLFLISAGAGAKRLQAICIPVDARTCALSFYICDAKGAALAPMSLTFPFGSRLEITLQIVPKLGWIRCRVNGQRSGDVMTKAFDWTFADSVVVGSETLSAEVADLWIKAWAVEGMFAE